MSIETLPHGLAMQKIIDESEFLAALAPFVHKKGTSILFNDALRMLTRAEIMHLEKNNNRCEVWENIRVVPNFTPDTIWGCFFIGTCFIGALHGPVHILPNGTPLAAGLYNTTVNTCEIGNGVHIHSVASLYKTIVCDGAVLCNVGTISCKGSTTFSNGTEIAVGIETGGRNIKLCSDLFIPLAHTLAIRRHDKILQDSYAQMLNTYCSACTSHYSIVGSRALVCNTPALTNVYLHGSAFVDGATLLEDVTILSSENEPTLIANGSIVRNSCVGFGCTVNDMAIVDSSLLTEHASVARHAKVTSSIIGPNTHIAEGEVTASLVGPFVGFHHQALLIAALWPEGKGNVAYGANVGSNHTGKAPDQEIFCGEGTFFGLDTCIKFPTDFTEAPFCIIASGVHTLPQRFEYPFSLINTPSQVIPGIVNGYNEAFPGWMLSNNMYALFRNEEKYTKRNKARRMPIATKIFSTFTIETMRAARDRLRNVTTPLPFYTKEHIGGLGTNFISEQTRCEAIDTYSFFITFFALNGLVRRYECLTKHGATPDDAIVYSSAAGDEEWFFVRNILAGEGLTNTPVAENLAHLCTMHRKVADSILASKKRDDKRGRNITGSRYDAHTIAESDPLVVQSQSVAKSIIATIETLLAKR